MSWITDIFRRWSKPETAEIAAPERTGYRSTGLDTTVADALAPKKLLTLLKAADQGDITSQNELFEEMEERDGEMAGLLLQRKSGVLACPSEIVPGDEKDPRSVEVADECRRMMTAIPRLRDRHLDLLGAIPRGFACLEVLWETSERQWSPRNLAFRPQRWWTVDQNDHNRLLLRDAANPMGVEVNPLNFITHIHHASSGSLTRAGLSRTCTRPYVIRNYSVKDWLALMEVYGMPPRIGTLPQGASEKDAELLWAALLSLGHDAFGMKPAGAEIEFADTKGATANSDIYEKLYNLAGRAMTMAILGQVLTSGGEQGGSYALGKVQENVRFDILDSDASRLDETLSGFYAVWTRLNHGPDVAPPRHRTKVQMPKDLVADSQVVSQLVSAGAKIPASWVYSHFEIPAPKDDEEVLTPAAGVTPQPPAGNPLLNSLPPIEKKKGGVLPSWPERIARSAGWMS